MQIIADMQKPEMISTIFKPVNKLCTYARPSCVSHLKKSATLCVNALGFATAFSFQLSVSSVASEGGENLWHMQVTYAPKCMLHNKLNAACSAAARAACYMN